MFRLEDHPGVRGRIVVKLNGEIVHDSGNLITDVGHSWAAQRFLGDGTPPDVISHVAIGSGTADLQDASQTTLGSEEARVAITTNYPQRTDNSIEVRASFGPGVGTATISEAGLFNAASTGSMFARTPVTPARPKGAQDTLDIIWTLTF